MGIASSSAEARSAIAAGLALTTGLVASFGATAQEATPAAGEADAAVTLPPVNVDAAEPTNTLRSSTNISRLPGTVQDTPQSITVITQETMRQQGVTSLEQALRNVPGVTLAIGEGNGGLNGDQFRIRGFDAKGDIYQDGLRDFGSYVRDSFNTEQIDVLKGPSSESFGFGSTGGVINNQTKRAHLGNAYGIEGSIGTGTLARAVADVNQQINETTAARIVGMVHEQDVADRDHVESDRWGIAGSLGFGLGTDTTWTLNYLHQHGDRTPDYGVPMVTRPDATVGRPVTEYDVSRGVFYGKWQDRDKSDVDMLTSLFSKKFNDTFTLSNDTRLAHYERDFATSVPGCNTACSDDFFAGLNPEISYGGGNPTYDQKSYGAQNVTTGIFNFNLGRFRNEAVVGLDLFYQKDDRRLKTIDGDKTPPTIRNPGDFYGIDDYGFAPGNVRKSDGTSVGAFASDRFWIIDQLSILGGIRYDKYDSNYTTITRTTGEVNDYSADNDFWSPKASIIFEPTPQQTYYVSYATSATLPGQYATLAPNPIGAATPDLEPEENESFEIGAKVSVLDDRLGLSGAVFRVNKSNAYYTDADGNSVATGEKQRVQGVELGVTGKITEAWTATLAYTYLDSEIRSSAATPSTVGNKVGNVPENSATLWTTYDVLSHVGEAVPGALLVGGGVTYQSEMYTASNNTSEVPETFRLDAFVSYQYENVRVALNGYNLTDELNYTGTFNNRAIPDSGRTFLLTVGAQF